MNPTIRRCIVALLGVSLLAGAAFSTPIAEGMGVGSGHGAGALPGGRPSGEALRIPAAAALASNGGPVQRSPVAYLIFWGASWSNNGALAADGQIAKTYFADVGSTSYANTLTQYSDSSGAIADTLTLGGVSLDTAHAIPTDSSCGGTTVGDAAIQSEVGAAIGAAGWPTDGANGLYVVFTPATVAVNDGSGACSERSFCAYHNWSSSLNLAYAVVAYPTDLTACGATASPNGDIQGDSLANLAAFAQFEAISDPRVTTGWLDSAGLGIAGKCAWNAALGTVGLANGGAFAIQPMFSNASNACVKEYGAHAAWVRNPGLFRPSTVTFYLSYVTPPPGAGTSLQYGDGTDIPLAGRWTAMGSDTIGLFRPSSSTFYLPYTIPPGGTGVLVTYGSPGDIPVVGDWTGKGYDSIGVYRPSNATFYLRNSNSPGPADIIFTYGEPGDVPLVGDWTGQGHDTVGVFRPSTDGFYLRNSDTAGDADITFAYGLPTDTPVVGDWTGKGYDSIGMYRPSTSTFYLRNSNSTGAPDLTFAWGDPGDKPLMGKWR